LLFKFKLAKFPGKVNTERPEWYSLQAVYGKSRAKYGGFTIHIFVERVISSKSNASLFFQICFLKAMLYVVNDGKIPCASCLAELKFPKNSPEKVFDNW